MVLLLVSIDTTGHEVSFSAFPKSVQISIPVYTGLCGIMANIPTGRGIGLMASCFKQTGAGVKSCVPWVQWHQVVPAIVGFEC